MTAWAGISTIVNRSCAPSLDRCDTVLREERDGASLLDVMFARRGTAGTLRDPEWAQPAVHALASALTGLWASAGIRPAVVAGQGIGELAAAWAAGLVTLEDGLRLAAARGMALARPRTRMAAAVPSAEAREDPFADLDAALKGVEFAAPSLTLLSQVTGQVLDSARASGADYWREQARAGQPLELFAKRLAELDIDLVVQLGSRTAGSPVPLDAWPESTEHEEFAESVARAYEAGSEVSFAGLVRRGDAAPDFPAGLPVPAQASLDRSGALSSRTSGTAC